MFFVHDRLSFPCLILSPYKHHREEKERRKIQYETAVRLAKETAEKIAAKAFTKAYLSPLMLSTFQQLLDRGYFYDSVEHGKLAIF